MSWRQSLDELPKSQRQLILGGGLSQRFVKWPLDITHPAMIGALYGLLVGLSLLLPIGQMSDWELGQWWKTFVVTTLVLMIVTASLGLLSRIIIVFTNRTPIAPPRHFLYPMPFIGLAWLSLQMTGLLDFWVWGAWFLLIIPGPIYIHISWAPRWRLLCKLEDGQDPFAGESVVGTDGRLETAEFEEDDELAEVVADFDDEE